MSRRIELELTSSRDDGTWTWRAAGAREPRGTLEASLLPAGAKVGDVLRAEADFDVEGITVLSVLPPKGTRPEPTRLELLGPPRPADENLVTTALVGGRRGDRGERGDRGDRGDRRGRSDRPDGRGRGAPGDRPDRGPRAERSDRGRQRPAGEGERPDGARGERPDGARGERPDGARGERRPRPPRPPRVEEPARPKPKRLRAGRIHRKAALEELPPEQQPVAEQVLQGGIPAVRAAVDKQNETLRAEGKTEVRAEPLVALAEQLLPRLRVAEWRDRAEAALADLDELDLRDLRSVVVAADVAARDDETRELAGRLREGLNRRVDEEQRQWLADLAAALKEGRVVRALRLSSRPPKAGALLPADLTTRLAQAASAALGADVAADRWAMVLDAVAFSPVRRAVTPVAIPANPSEELKAVIAKLGSRLPEIAALFGIEPAPPGKRPPRPPRPKPAAKQPAPEPAPAESAAAPEPEPEAAPADSADAAEPAAKQPAPEPAPADSADAPEPAAAPEPAPAESAPAPEPEPADSESAPSSG